MPTTTEGLADLLAIFAEAEFRAQNDLQWTNARCAEVRSGKHGETAKEIWAHAVGLHCKIIAADPESRQ